MNVRRSATLTRAGTWASVECNSRPAATRHGHAVSDDGDASAGREEGRVRENWVKQKLRKGSVSIGSWVSMDDVLAAEVMANAGFDWLVIDMEHGPVSMQAAQRIIAAIRTTATVPLVRVGWNESGLIQPALDIGAFGLVVPMVNTRAQAQQVIRDTRYPPLGERSRGGMRARLAFGTDAVTYGLRANDETLVLVQLETAEG